MEGIWEEYWGNMGGEYYGGNMNSLLFNSFPSLFMAPNAPFTYRKSHQPFIHPIYRGY